ncbi:Uncharacterised protein [Zhongshania aliphaticivorans]|uniref:Uncharacterized protein n=1 Tax=Zhongshania aliphaticivorans TaxID=1470434 RepID=A0A5S9N6C9_9GAMM|nr:hypothetical protein [Zhongshania aliphaticivorans]CAA0081347.1 Uncharacterised protein [Zhongshania aliphaticivorans]CAA0085093.1 Uncharacterised protein [Zhongshania aliphaticivorans]
MGSKSKSSTSSTSNTLTETLNAALNDEAVLATKGAAARDSAVAVNSTVGIEGSNNYLNVTDHGAIAQALRANENVTSAALDAADKAGARSAASQGSVLNTTRNILNDQVDAVKNLAESLKLGDEQTAKLIAIALIVGVVLVALVYVYKG